MKKSVRKNTFLQFAQTFWHTQKNQSKSRKLEKSYPHLKLEKRLEKQVINKVIHIIHILPIRFVSLHSKFENIRSVQIR